MDEQDVRIKGCPSCGFDGDVERFEWHGDLWVRCYVCDWQGTVADALDIMDATKEQA